MNTMEFDVEMVKNQFRITLKTRQLTSEYQQYLLDRFNVSDMPEFSQSRYLSLSSSFNISVNKFLDALEAKETDLFTSLRGLIIPKIEEVNTENDVESTFIMIVLRIKLLYEVYTNMA